MRRRETILAMLAACFGARPAWALKPILPVVDSLLEIYREAAAAHTAGSAPASEEAFLSVFTPSTRAAWKAARANPPKSLGPVTNAFFGRVLPRVPVTVDGAYALRSGRFRSDVRVGLSIRGEQTFVVVDARMINDRWLIEDISYADGRSFLAIQRGK